jgi:hypothetical protein
VSRAVAAAGGGPRHDLQSCLAHFVARQETGWKCAGCGFQVLALKSVSYRRVAETLIIQLKRNRGVGAKLTTLVDFPLGGLDFRPYMSEPGGPVLFDLWAIAFHSGGKGAPTISCRFYASLFESMLDSGISVTFFSCSVCAFCRFVLHFIADSAVSATELSLPAIFLFFSASLYFIYLFYPPPPPLFAIALTRS